MIYDDNAQIDNAQIDRSNRWRYDDMPISRNIWCNAYPACAGVPACVLRIICMMIVCVNPIIDY